MVLKHLPWLLLGVLPAFAAETIIDGIKDGELVLNLRFRIEFVDQQGKPKDALAPTLRTRLGYKTAGVKGWSALVEFENVTIIGDTRFNDTVNGDGRFPVVADPEDTEVNRLSLHYKGWSKQEWILGRQRIILDNARFVGNVGWRQNEQTFDALLWRYAGIQRTKLTLAYLDNANQIFGANHPTRSDTRQATFLINGKIDAGKAGTLVVFGYFLDFKNSPLAAHKNLGLIFKGKHKLANQWFWSHDLSYVDQSSYRNGADSIEAAYVLLKAGVGHGPLSFHLAVEVLEGNGRYAFVTPLATLHGFNGWADLFLNTPLRGLVDNQFIVDYRDHGWRLLLVAHKFESDAGNLDYGSEINGLASKKISKRASVGFKFADYQADDFGQDITKIWGFGQFVW